MNKYIGENRLTYLWGKIKAFVSNAISGKVDKVSSSTDNAIVRFDGTSGNIQNSGATIDDNNHLTAARLITSGGTSSQFVKGDGSLDSNAYATESYVDDEIDTLTDGTAASESGNVIDVAEYDLMKIREIKGSSQVYEDTVVGNNVEKLDVYDTNDTKKGSIALNLTELTGKVNGEGTSVTIFPDGLHGVGTAYDSLIVDEDGYARKAVKRMWSVDLGSLTWLKYTQSEHNRFQATISPTPYASSRVPNIINGYGYYGSRAPYGNNDEDLALMYYSGSIYLRNDIYENSTAADFKTAMSGVMLYYELATPIEYVLDTPVQCVAKVYPNGTVKQVPVMPDSTPMVMDVTYLHDTGGVIGGLINHLASLEANLKEIMKGIKTISVQYGDTTNIVLETEKLNGNSGSVSIPSATSQAAGAMSAAQAAKLEDLESRVNTLENS